MLTYQRTTCILGLICLLGMAPGMSPVARAAPAARRVAPRMSGPRDRPVPGDSRYPGRHGRPNGALLGPLGRPTLRLLSERIEIRCRFGGGGCALRHDFVIQNTADATTVTLPVISPRRAVLAEVNGKPATVNTAPLPPRPRRWSSSGWGIDPGSGESYKLPGPKRYRVLRAHRVRVSLGARSRVTLTLITNSVAGYDRFRRGRTQAEVAFSGTRREDNFVYHHELPLTDPAARGRPGGGRDLPVTWILPAHLKLGANTKVTCKRAGRHQQRCTARLKTTAKTLRWSIAERYRRPVGFFLGVGLAFTHRGVEAHLRAGASLMLRSHQDLLTLTAETDAKERFAMALTYQLFLPYSPYNWELGAHFELGLALDLYPAVRPAIRAGTTLHIGAIRVNLLFDLYPGELKAGGGPSWRGVVGAGFGF